MRLFFAIIIALSSAFAYPLGGGAEFFFSEKNHDFTDTKAGTVLKHDYSFTNSGNLPILISDYKVACTCTKIFFPKTPVQPGESGKIHLEFDTTGKQGFQSRKIEIISNVKKRTRLSFRVFVLDAP